MIAQIGPLVQAGARYRLGLSHITGGLLGGLTIGVLAGFTASLLSVLVVWPSSIIVGALVVALGVSAAADTSWIRLPRFSVKRQTPGAWRCSFGVTFGVFAWGFDLGLGFSTRLTSYAMFVLPIYAALSAQFAATVTAFTTFGVARACTTVALAVRHGKQAPQAASCLGDEQRLLLRLGSVASLASIATLLFISL
jgi:hypothetical protein